MNIFVFILSFIFLRVGSPTTINERINTKMFKKTVPPVPKFGEITVTANAAVISAEMSSVSILADLCGEAAERGKRKIVGWGRLLEKRHEWKLHVHQSCFACHA